jgi:hypothetical protein
MQISNRDVKWIIVCFTIRGIYGEVTYCKYLNVKNGLVKEFENMEDITKSHHGNIFPLMSPSFDVWVGWDKSLMFAKYDIQGLPVGLSEEDYYRMAKIQTQQELYDMNSMVRSWDDLTTEDNKDGFKEYLDNHNQIIKKNQNGLVGDTIIAENIMRGEIDNQLLIYPDSIRFNYNKLYDKFKQPYVDIIDYIEEDKLNQNLLVDMKYERKTLIDEVLSDMIPRLLGFRIQFEIVYPKRELPVDIIFTKDMKVKDALSMILNINNGVMYINKK